jgi:dTDP-4-dehydrorhamnose 3,5-epimerase
MIIEPTPLAGASLIRLQEVRDNRGFFARSFCERELENHGVPFDVSQCNISFNHNRGTIRGMHYQAEPSPEMKIVRVTQGSILDVIFDLRPESATYLQSFSVELSAANRISLLIPIGFAHGFQTLQDDTEVFYMMSGFFDAPSARGIRFDDPAFGFKWPLPIGEMSDKDRSYLDFQP